MKAILHGGLQCRKNLYRVVIGTFDDRASAENLRDSFKAKHPSNDDFQKAWLLYSVN